MAFLAKLSTILQMSYLAALCQFVSAWLDGYGMLREAANDPQLMAGALSQGLVTSILFALVGFVGLLLGWFCLRSGASIPLWFRRFSKYSSYLWLTFVPLGTVFGILQLRKLKQLSESGDIMEGVV